MATADRGGPRAVQQKLAERLVVLQIPANKLRGSSDRTKINRRSAGFRLACEVLVLVVAVGKRERNVVDQHADQR